MAKKKTINLIEISEIGETQGLQETTRKEISTKFQAFIDQADEWMKKAQAIKITDASQTKEMKQAREARLALAKIRNAADKIREELKRDSIQYGRAVQAVYNAIEGKIKPIEAVLKEQEDFVRIAEEKRLNEIRETRLSLVDPYKEFMLPGVDVALMDEAQFNEVLEWVKGKWEQDQEAKKEAEKKEEEERQRKAEEDERLRIENERLKAEAEKLRKEKAEAERIRKVRAGELSPYLIFIRDYDGLINKPEKEYQKEFADIKKGAMQKWEYDREKEKEEAEARAKEEDRINKLWRGRLDQLDGVSWNGQEALFNHGKGGVVITYEELINFTDKKFEARKSRNNKQYEEQVERDRKEQEERIAKELKDKQEEEARLKAEQEEKAKASMSDKAKLQELANTIGAIEMPNCDADEYQKVASDVKKLLLKVQMFIEDKIV